MAQSAEYPDLAFVTPRHWSRGRVATEYGHGVQYLVVHYTAGAERSTSAEDGAAYDQRREDSVSTHYFVDSNSVVQCILTKDTAFAAYRYGNAHGIQYELCGTVQTRAQWLDPASDATLTNAARQMARDCQRYGLPVRRLTLDQMRRGEKGICGHVDVTHAYGRGDHTDPGTEFPWDVLLSRVQQFLDPQGDDMSERLEWFAHQFETLENRYPAEIMGGRETKFITTYRQLLVDVAELKARPPVQPAPIDAASLKAALLDPEVQAALVETVRQGANAAEDS